MLSLLFAVFVVPMLPFVVPAFSEDAPKERVQHVESYVVSLNTGDKKIEHIDDLDAVNMVTTYIGRVAEVDASTTASAVVSSDPALASSSIGNVSATVKVLAMPGGVIEINEGDRGWLGVGIAEVPEALSVQMEIDGGMLVTNVVEDSPADEAGIRRHDVIVEVDGEQVPGSVRKAVSQIAQRKPGEEVEIVIYRAGEMMTLDVVLGQRASAAKKWKFDAAPLAEIEEKIMTRGKIMTRDSDGNWTVKDLGDLSALPNLPTEVQGLMPQAGSKSMVFVDGEDVKTSINIVKGDGSISIQRDAATDSIIVERTGEDGEKELMVYTSPEQLKDGDEEAYDLLFNNDVKMFHFGDTDDDATFNIEFDFDDFATDLIDLRGDSVDMQVFVDGAKDGFRDAMEEFAEHLDQIDIGKTHAHVWTNLIGADSDSDDNGYFTIVGKPKHTFEVNEQGKIEVRIRKGDSELVQIFADEDDLADRAPDLFKKYEGLMELK